MSERLTPDELARLTEKQAELYADTADNNTAPISDDELARRFTDRNSDRFRYCATLGRWYEWRSTHWAQDETKAVYDVARLSCKLDLGFALAQKPKEAVARSLRAKLGSAATIAAVVKMASADRRHAVTHAARIAGKSDDEIRALVVKLDAARKSAS